MFPFFAARNKSVAGHSVSNSLRLNDDDSAYLEFQPTSVTSERIGTISVWVRIGNLGTDRRIWTCERDDAALTFGGLYLTSSDKLEFRVETSGGGILMRRTTTAVYRDVGSFLHVCVSWDSNQTDSTCVTMTVNGGVVTAFDNQENNSSAQDLAWPSTSKPMRWGRHITAANYFDGLLSELIYVDGLEYAATQFIEIDNESEPRPIEISGVTWGGAGSYLELKNSTTGSGAVGQIGEDSSGNGNHWDSTNGLDSTDQLTDSPTNVFSALSSIDKDSNIVLADGNLYFDNSAASNSTVASTFKIPSTGVWGVKAVNVNGCTSTAFRMGIADQDLDVNGSLNVSGKHSVCYQDDGKVYVNGSLDTSGLSTGNSASDKIEIFADMDSGEVKVFVNDVQQGTTYTIPSGYDDVPMLFYFNGSDTTTEFDIDFGQLGYDPDATVSGALTLSTANMTALTFDPSDHHHIASVNHDGISTGFTLPWDADTNDTLFIIKNRDAVEKWYWVDTLTGITQYWSSDAGAGLTTDSNVISVSGTTATLGSTLSANNYDVECHRAGAAGGVTNNDGTKTSTVSANSVTGFSITKVASISPSDDFGHGLGATPDFIIAVDNDTATNIIVWHSAIYATSSNTGRLHLENANPTATSTFSINACDTSTITVGSGATFAGNYTFYSWSAVEGYSAFGKYEGNTNVDGPVINSGVSPKSFFVKHVDNTEGWFVLNEEFSGDNEAQIMLRYDTTAAEADNSPDGFDFLAAGFKVRGNWAAINTNTLIYGMWGIPTGPNQSGTPAKAR